MQICVFCSSSTRIDESYVDLAAAVGSEIGRRGHGLVSGGGSVSCMGAVARAARAAGAHTVGVIPEALRTLEFADTDADELLVVQTMRERKAEMDRRADAFLALPGGIGTLEELFEIWTARTLGMHDKPVVVLDPHWLFAPLRAQLDALLAAGFLRPHVFDAITFAGSLDEAFAALEAPTVTKRPAPEEVLEAEP